MGELFDLAIRLYRRKFLTFVGLAAVVQIPLIFIRIPLTYFTTGSMIGQARNPLGVAGNFFTLFLLVLASESALEYLLVFANFVLIQGLGTVALTRAVAHLYSGRPIDIISAYQGLNKAWWRLIITLLLAMLPGGLFMIVFWIPCLGWITSSGTLFFYLWCVVPLVAPVVILEQKSLRQAIRRAWDLARRRFWWVFGFGLTLLIFGQLMVSGPAFLAMFLLDNVFGPPTPFWLGSDQGMALRIIIQLVVNMIFGMLYFPLQIICITLLYFNLRVQSEGFDLTWQAEHILDEHISLPGVMAQAPGPERSGLLTWREVGYFIVLAIISLGLLFVLGLGAMGFMF